MSCSAATLQRSAPESSTSGRSVDWSAVVDGQWIGQRCLVVSGLAISGQWLVDRSAVVRIGRRWSVAGQCRLVSGDQWSVDR